MKVPHMPAQRFLAEDCTTQLSFQLFKRFLLARGISLSPDWVAKLICNCKHWCCVHLFRGNASMLHIEVLRFVHPLERSPICKRMEISRWTDLGISVCNCRYRPSSMRADCGRSEAALLLQRTQPWQSGGNSAWKSCICPGRIRENQ